MNDNNNKLIVTSNSLSKIENQVTIGNKILLRKNRKVEIVDFLIKFTIDGGYEIKEFFNAFTFVSNQYPLSLEMIGKYEKHLNFDYLSTNTNIIWFEGLIDLYLDKWNWKKLSSNKGLPLTVSFIEKYEDYFDWKELCSNEKLPWNKEFILKYMDYLLDWDIAEVIAINKNIQWTEELISLFDEKKTSGAVECLFDVDKVCCGRFNIQGRKVEKNGKVFYVLNEKHHLKLKYDNKVFGNLDNSEICWSCLCRTINNINENFLISNNNRIDWYSLSENELCLTEEIIEKFKDKFSWTSLSSNEKLPWSIDFIKKFEENWDWEYLSNNEGIPWSEELIDAFVDRWDWDSVSSISTNPKIPISIDFINKYKNHLDIGTVFSINEGNFWTEEFINYFENHKQSWWFSYNKNFPWSIEMIKRFKQYRCNPFKHEKVISEILPFLDDENICYIFDKIIESNK